ncbi:MAG: hypothetical protein AAF430_18335 [Myxococcota bacterium]
MELQTESIHILFWWFATTASLTALFCVSQKRKAARRRFALSALVLVPILGPFFLGVHRVFSSRRLGRRPIARLTLSSCASFGSVFLLLLLSSCWWESVVRNPPVAEGSCMIGPPRPPVARASDRVPEVVRWQRRSPSRPFVAQPPSVLAHLSLHGRQTAH